MTDERRTLAQLIQAGRREEISQADFARGFAQTRLVLLSASAPTADEAEPLTLELPSGHPAVAVFGSMSEAHEEYRTAAPHSVIISGRELLGILPGGVGLALNPGNAVSLRLEPEEVPAFAFVALNPR